MSHALDFQVIHDTEAKCQEVIGALPATGELLFPVETVFTDNDYTGFRTFNNIVFDTEAERDTAWDVIVGIVEVINGCNVGTYVRKYSESTEHIIYEVV